VEDAVMHVLLGKLAIMVIAQEAPVQQARPIVLVLVVWIFEAILITVEPAVIVVVEMRVTMVPVSRIVLRVNINVPEFAQMYKRIAKIVGRVVKFVIKERFVRMAIAFFIVRKGYKTVMDNA